ncbi:Thermostable monoacylglycerol lipase [Jeotgalicoccus saudimassiliensis]|uniref:Thermostable monoacylglycerol lipase n=1 Tax=Jeotgalicoccus saudimassiliensis TaxID=1461582 RepID=A0A078MAY3_9STAP|nr:alpha/beta fold hydrolase [Jeotgalicoccus saudimassiliensis]CEA03369.1 Thermostable monoacylglycerol lipase [Jeotgalicoccus saudimassiliensis]
MTISKIGILFLHGYTGGRFELEPAFRYLKKRYDFEYEFPQYPGHGTTLNLAAAAGDDWYREAEKAYFNLAARTDKIYVIGFSMGGVFAGFIAQNYKVDKLVLIAPAFDHTRLSRLHRLKLSPEEVNDHLKMNLVSKLRPRLKNIPIRAMKEFIKIVDKKTGELESIKCDTLLIHGRIDLLVPYETSIEAAKKIPQAKLVLMEHTPHLIMFAEDKQLELNILVERFLFLDIELKYLVD